jgi:hypothetical protein
MPRVPCASFGIFLVSLRFCPVMSGFRDGVVHPNCMIYSGDDGLSSAFARLF